MPVFFFAATASSRFTELGLLNSQPSKPIDLIKSNFFSTGPSILIMSYLTALRSRGREADVASSAAAAKAAPVLFSAAGPKNAEAAAEAAAAAISPPRRGEVLCSSATRHQRRAPG